MLKHKILKSLFLKNTLKVSSGTFIAQLLMLAGMPIITRLYDKETIGVYALFTSTIGITTVFVTLAYDNAILLPKKKEDANAILKIVIFTSLLLSLLIGLTLLLPFDFFSEYRPIAIFIGCTSFFQGMVNALSYFKIRYNQFNVLSISKILRNVTLLISQIALYYIASSYGLIIGFLFSAVLTISYLMYKDENIKEAVFKRQKKAMILDRAKEYKEYPRYFCWSNLMFAISSGIPVLVFNEYFNLAQVALYSIAFSIIAQPAGLISASIRPVLLSKLAELKRDGQSILKIYNRVFYGLFGIGVLISIGIYFVLPPLVTFVFGDSWTQSGILTGMLIPLFLMELVSIPSSVSLKIYPFQKYAFYYTFLSLLITIVSLIICVYNNIDFKYVVLIFALSKLLVVLLNHMVVKKKIVNYELK